MNIHLCYLVYTFATAIIPLYSALGNYILLYLTSTISPYLMGILIFLLAISFTLSWRNWRQRKQSPYFFLRQQAEQRLQRYALLTIGIVLAMVVLSTYSLPSSQSADQSYALLRNAKPLLSNELDEVEDEGAQVVRFDESAVSIADASNEDNSQVLSDEDSPDVVTSAATDEHISNVAFSTEISDALEPIGASTNFGEGQYTLYATFFYEQMEAGMVWSWIWRQGDTVIGSGSEAWEYGDEGNGYIFLAPEEGFASGEYALEIQVEGTKVSQSSLNVSSSFAR